MGHKPKASTLARPNPSRYSELIGDCPFDLSVEDPSQIPLEHARIKQFGGRTFVVGQAPRSHDIGRAYTGSTPWVPFNDVIRMSEFATLEEWSQGQRLVKREHAKTP
jgi:hypothetical protein